MTQMITNPNTNWMDADPTPEWSEEDQRLMDEQCAAFEGWSKKIPTKDGDYWLYAKLRRNEPEIYFCQVVTSSNKHKVYLCRGATFDPRNLGPCYWARIIYPSTSCLHI